MPEHWISGSSRCHDRLGSAASRGASCLLGNLATASAGIEKFYRVPTAGELSQHLRHALEWVQTHAEAALAKAVLIYAWNENDEGGWLVPTLEEGDWRVQAVRKVLRNRRH